MASEDGAESSSKLRRVSLEGHLALHDNEGEWEVSNLFTDEVLELESGRLELRFIDGSPHLYDFETRRSECLAPHFEWAVFQDDSGQMWKMKSVGSVDEAERLPIIAPASTVYPTFCLEGQTASLPVHYVEVYSPGCNFWWQALCLAQLLVGASRRKPSAWVLDLWSCWGNGFGELFPTGVGFVKGVPRGGGQERSYSRWAVEHVVSTLALVWLFSSRATSARPATSRPKIREHFGVFLNKFFVGERLAIHLALDPDHRMHVGTTSVVGHHVVELAIDHGALVLAGLFVVGGVLASGVIRLLKKCSSYDLANNTVSLADALIQVVKEGPTWLSTQLLLQTAMAVEMVMNEAGFTQNPCDLMQYLPETWRWNEDLKDALALGRGPTGSGETAVLPGQHARSVLSFIGKRSRTGKPKQLSFHRAEASLLSRYRVNCKDFFAGCNSISIAADATRLGGRDILLVVAVGHRADGQRTLVMPDYNRYTFEVDESCMSGEEWADILEHKRWFQSALRGFFAKAPMQKRKKLERRASYWFLMALNNSVVQLAGFGLEAFVSPATGSTMHQYGIQMAPGGALGVGRGGMLGLNIDQHSVGWCAVNFMKYGLGLKVEATPDVFHRCWNDVKLAMGRSGWWESVLLSSIWINVNFGPWGGAKFWRETQGAAEEYFKHNASETCGLFLALLPHIAVDRGEEERLAEAGYASEIFEMLKGGAAWATKGPKMALCRWFGWLHCIAYWLPMVSLRLVVLLYWGISMGYVTGAADTMTLRLEGLARQESSSGSSQRATMAQAQASSRKLFDRAKNTLHIATLLLMDRSLTRVLKVAKVMCSPFERWYHEARVQLRSSQASLNFHKEQSLGACLLPLLQTFGHMQNKTSLKSMGFTTTLAELPLRSFGDGDDEGATDEDEWARKVFRLGFELVRARLRSVLAYMEYYPLAFGAFLSDSDRDQGVALRRMREVSAAWGAAQECDLPHVKAMVKRSFMFGQVAASSFEALARDEREAIQVFRDTATVMLSVGHTAIIEDAFQRLRLRETRASSHSEISPRAVWATTLQREVLTKLYKYNSCGTSVAPVVHVECSQKPVGNDVYLPGKTKPSVPLKGIIGTSSSVPWASMSPQSAHVQLADVAAWRKCLSEGHESWAKLGRGWLNRLSLPGMLVRRKASAGVQGEWWWSLGAVESEAVLLWKNCEQDIGGRKCHFPAHGSEFAKECYRWDVILDHRQWECMPISFASPRRLLNEAMPDMRVGAVAVQKGSPAPLLEMCAREGFVDFPVSLLRSMCVDLGISVGQDMNLCQVLWTAIRGCVPGVDEGEVVEILHRRLQPEQLVDSNFWTREEVVQCFDKGDEEIVKKYKNDMLDAKHGSAAHNSLWQYTKQVNESKAKAKAKGRAKVQQSRTLTAADRKFNPKPADLLSEASAQSYLPDNAKVWKDGRENRWVIRFKPYGSISRSWTVYGEIGAFGRCSAWAWAQNEAAGLQPCPFPWLSQYSWHSGA